LPLLWIARASLVSRAVAYRVPPDWLARPTLENYVSIFANQDFARYFVTSLAVCGLGATIAIVVGGLAAYGISRAKANSGGLVVALLSGQLFPRIALIIPIYTIMRFLGLYDNFWVMVLTYLSFMLPAAAIVLVPFFGSIPIAFEEAATVDGASRLDVLVRIIVPIAAPGMAAAWVFAFVLGWNEFLFPLFLGGREMQLLTVSISAFVTQRGVEIGPVAAGTMVAIVPALLLFFVARRYLIHGLAAGGVRA